VNHDLDMTQVPGIWLPLLQHLHPASFKALTHLSLGISTSLFKQGHWQGGLTILDPYLGLCDTPLANFVALETLEINLVFRGSLDVHVASSFGAQWGELCDVLTRRDAFPKLRRVGISTCVVAAGGPGIGANRPLANLFAETFDYIVRPQFRALEVLDSEGVLDFSFSVSVVTGERWLQS
jgi:hypothetical protein